MKRKKLATITATLALAASAVLVPLAPASAHHTYEPPNYWLCGYFPFLCGGR